MTDPEGYKAYVAANAAPFGKLARASWSAAARARWWRASVRARTVVLEFPSYEAALACYRSPEYQAAAALRQGKAELDLFIIEGYDGPQPT